MSKKNIENIASILMKEIECLLNQIDGVEVSKVVISADYIRVELTIETHESHLLLEYCAEASNVPLQCWAKYRPGSEKAISNPAKALGYRYSSKSREGQPGEVIYYFALLGAFLSRRMFESGNLSGDEKKRLSKLFEAVDKSINKELY
jgi:hypothetical protein